MSDAATEATADPQPQKAFGRTYWLLNSIEALERLAYFGIQQPHLLFAMVAHHPWPHDIGFLQALLESSPQAVAAARDKAGKDLSPQEIAESLTVIQAALSAIDWVQHADAAAKIIGKNVFEGGFLGLDNIGVFDRSAALPTGGHLEQADGTAWMAFFCATMILASMITCRTRLSRSLSRAPIYVSLESMSLTITISL